MRTNHLNLLLVLVLVLFPMSTRAYGAGECVMLYTPTLRLRFRRESLSITVLTSLIIVTK